jgi:hypothetical protein
MTRRSALIGTAASGHCQAMLRSLAGLCDFGFRLVHQAGAICAMNADERDDSGDGLATELRSFMCSCSADGM